MTLQGRRTGTACCVTGVVASSHSWMHAADLPRVASPRLDRLAHLALFGRYMKAQPRLAGGRRKPCRNGLGSDIPMECVTLLAQCVGPPDNTCDLRLTFDFKRLQVFYTWSHRTNTSQYSTHSSCRHTGKADSSGRTQALPQGPRPPGMGFPGVGWPRGDTIDEKAFRDALT